MKLENVHSSAKLSSLYQSKTITTAATATNKQQPQQKQQQQK